MKDFDRWLRQPYEHPELPDAPCPATGLESDDHCDMCDDKYHSSVIKGCENCDERLCPTCSYTDPELDDMVFCGTECDREFKEK